MKYSYKKYVVLAILGSLIIGVAVYLFLNSYLEKTGIIVLQKNIFKGEVIKENDISIGYFLKNSLPAGYIKTESEILGKEINTDRFKGDYLTGEMFSKEKETNLSENLNPEEVLISINLDPKEKIVEQLKAGKKITIVSTEKDKEMEDLFYKENFNTSSSSFKQSSDNMEINTDSKNLNILSNTAQSEDYLESSVIKLSENINLIDGYLVVENIEILAIKNFQTKNTGILMSNENGIITLYLKCKIIESPYLAKLSSSGKYKILVGKNQS